MEGYFALEGRGWERMQEETSLDCRPGHLTCKDGDAGDDSPATRLAKACNLPGGKAPGTVAAIGGM